MSDGAGISNIPEEDDGLFVDDWEDGAEKLGAGLDWMLRCVFPTLRMLLCVLPQEQDDAMCPFPSSGCCTSSRSSES